MYTEKSRAIEILEVFLAKTKCACGCGTFLIEGFDRRYINLSKYHIDFNRTNNSFDNFNIMRRGHHISYHKRLRKEAQAIGEGIKNLFEAAENVTIKSVD